MSTGSEESTRVGAGWLKALLRPVAKGLIYRALTPAGPLRIAYNGLYHAGFLGRELHEWARRSLLATPMFLSQCAAYGSDIAVERMPYLSGPCRIELGSRIRFGGQVDILAAPTGAPLLKIHDGVYLGHIVSFALARRIEIGRYVSIGGHSHISDTEGHAQYNPGRPIWEVGAGDEDVAEVVIEDNVQIGHGCQILKGVRIGARSVIGAGSVVRTSIPPDSVVMGNPARVVRRLQPAPSAGDSP
ncbi:MAG: acyltransferase [Proteobacteria bacterium]|nr:acyltransferase [Pseudomonadota bacterium]